MKNWRTKLAATFAGIFTIAGIWAKPGPPNPEDWALIGATASAVWTVWLGRDVLQKVQDK
jgi:hypothetical protein